MSLFNLDGVVRVWTLINLTRKVVMNIEDMIDYYAIAKDSKNIMRVEELACKRDEAEAKGDISEVANIDSELNNMKGAI